QTGQNRRAKCEAEIGLERVGQTKIVTRPVCLFLISCFPNSFNGSPKTQNIKDAIAHAESGKPLARLAAKQMPTVWEQRAVAHRLPIVRLLPWPPGPDVGRQVTVAVVLWAM